MNVTISIPDDLVAVLSDSAEHLGARVQIDLAVQYYQQGVISMGRAVEMSGLRRGEFERMLGERQILRNYGEDDLRDDLASA